MYSHFWAASKPHLLVSKRHWSAIFSSLGRIRVPTSHWTNFGHHLLVSGRHSIAIFSSLGDIRAPSSRLWEHMIAIFLYLGTYDRHFLVSGRHTIAIFSSLVDIQVPSSCLWATFERHLLVSRWHLSTILSSLDRSLSLWVISGANTRLWPIFELFLPLECRKKGMKAFPGEKYLWELIM